MKTTVQKIIRYPKVIKLFFDYSDRNFTPLEISKTVKIPYATIWRYVQDLKKSGVIQTEKIGEYNVCRLNKNSPLINELKGFIKLQLSPHWLAINEFMSRIKNIHNVERMILFGCVSKNMERLGSDIDIAVIVDIEN